MDREWRRLLLTLAGLPDKVFAWWSMSNGAKFVFAIPSSDKIAEDRFVESVEFPFLFSEIRGIEIPGFIGSGKMRLVNSLVQIRLAMPPNLELTIRDSPDAIVISR